MTRVDAMARHYMRQPIVASRILLNSCSTTKLIQMFRLENLALCCRWRQLRVQRSSPSSCLRREMTQMYGEDTLVMQCQPRVVRGASTETRS